MYVCDVNPPIYSTVAQYSRRMCWFMAAAWVVIAVKCALVWWAMAHWSVPFHPLWIVGPTLAFAALATMLWMTCHDD